MPRGSQTEDTAGLRRVGLFALAVVLAWAIIGLYAVHAALPVNPVRLPLATRIDTQVWIPQGWKFFTRSPREEEILFFVRSGDGTWRSVSRALHVRPSNVFGLNRTSRALGIEGGLLLGKVPRAAWQACRERPGDCLERVSRGPSVKNSSPHPMLCGEVGIALQKPVPWAWNASKAQIMMPSRLARLEVDC